jgi:hypothetical protein
LQKRLTDEVIGKMAILTRGYAKGLIGILEPNLTGIGVAPYLHVTKSEIRTGVIYHKDIELLYCKPIKETKEDDDFVQK